jgi:hypothetical protein
MATSGSIVGGQDERSTEVLDAIRRIMQEAEQQKGAAPDLLARIESLLPQTGLIEQLIRILVEDHPDARWIDIRPTVEWALSVRNGAEEALLGMVLRREVVVTNTDYLQLKLNSGSE